MNLTTHQAPARLVVFLKPKAYLWHSQEWKRERGSRELGFFLKGRLALSVCQWFLHFQQPFHFSPKKGGWAKKGKCRYSMLICFWSSSQSPFFLPVKIWFLTVIWLGKNGIYPDCFHHMRLWWCFPVPAFWDTNFGHLRWSNLYLGEAVRNMPGSLQPWLCWLLSCPH